MNSEDRLDRLEDVVMDLAAIMQERSGAFASDVSSTVQYHGQRYQIFANAVSSERFGGEILDAHPATEVGQRGTGEPQLEIGIEGWFVDPYHVHEARWFSNGAPTALVRDGQSESNDPPPDVPFEGPLEHWGVNTAGSPDDLRRADDSNRKDSDEAIARAAFDAFDRRSSPR